MRAGVYEYTKASSAAISKIADAIAPLTSLTGAIMEVNNRLSVPHSDSFLDDCCRYFRRTARLSCPPWTTRFSRVTIG
jgi:hypothetical protein